MQTGDSFVHLHVASGYSRQFAASHPHVLVERAAEQEMDTLALTDRDSLAGAVKFAKACLRTGIRPVLGVDLAVTPMLAGWGDGWRDGSPAPGGRRTRRARWVGRSRLGTTRTTSGPSSPGSTSASTSGTAPGSGAPRTDGSGTSDASRALSRSFVPHGPAPPVSRAAQSGPSCHATACRSWTSSAPAFHAR